MAARSEVLAGAPAYRSQRIYGRAIDRAVAEAQRGGLVAQASLDFGLAVKVAADRDAHLRSPAAAEAESGNRSFLLDSAIEPEQWPTMSSRGWRRSDS